MLSGRMKSGSHQSKSRDFSLWTGRHVGLAIYAGEVIKSRFKPCLGKMNLRYLGIKRDFHLNKSVLEFIIRKVYK